MYKLVATMAVTATASATALALMSTAAKAQSADGMTNWEGVYGSAFIGGLSSSTHWKGNGTFDGGEGGGTGGEGAGTALSSGNVHSGTSASGFLGGIGAGYNFQMDNFVVGGVADIGLTSANSSKRFSDSTFDVRLHTSISNMETLRAKLGFAFDNFLVYGTGGIAWADVSNKAVVSNFSGDTRFRLNNTSGGVFGGGVEVMIMPQVSLFAEYLRADLGQDKRTVVGPGVSGVIKVDTTADIFKFGANWHF